MKKTAIVIVLLIMSFAAQSQELVIDSIDMKSFKGIISSGDMGEILLVPYFTTNKTKQNFIIKQINTMSFSEDNVTRLEIPSEYELVNVSGGMQNTIIVFRDTKKNEYVMMNVVAGNIVTKKTIKQNGNTLMLIDSKNPDEYILVDVNKNGGYTIQLLDDKLETKTKKTYTPSTGTWDIISIKQTLEGLTVVRRENKPNNKYAFYVQGINPSDGEELYAIPLKYEEINTYPMFFTSSEGITVTGGVYFRNGLNNNQKPDGVYVSTVTPDGEGTQTLEVPYSQVLEDLKVPLGSTLNNAHSGIIIRGGTLSQELQSYLLVGEIFTRNENTNGTTSYQQKDIVVLKFGMEEGYLGAEHYAVAAKEANISGNVSSLSDYDLASWVNQTGFGSYQNFMNSPLLPTVVYTKHTGNEGTQICYQQVGSLVSDIGLNPICNNVIHHAGNSSYSYAYMYNTAPIYPNSNSGLLSGGMMMDNVKYYTTNGQQLFISGIPAPRFEELVNEEIASKIEEERMKKIEAREEMERKASETENENEE